MPKSLKTLAQEARVPGISLAFSQSDSLLQTRTFGVADVRTGSSVSEETRFEVASLSKPVFAYMILKLVEAGFFSREGESPESGLTRPLFEMADFGPPHLRADENYRSINVAMILSHQAALPNEFSSTESEVYLAKVGTRFDYSGIAYYFLNEILEKRTGQSLETLAQAVFQRLGMTHTSFILPSKDTPQRMHCAVGHTADRVPDDTEHFPFGPHPAASLVTTASDYLQFLQACRADPFVRKHMFHAQISLKDMDHKAMAKGVNDESLASLSWGLGIGLLNAKDKNTIAFHWGDINTSRSFAAIDIDTGEAVICLTNSANGPAMFRAVCEPILGSLHPVFEWLKLREGLPIKSLPHTPNDAPAPKTTKDYRAAVLAKKAKSDTSQASAESHEITPLRTTPKKE